MAETTVAPNNKSVAFSGRTEREMSSWNNKGIANSNGGKSNPAGLGKSDTRDPVAKPKRVNAEGDLVNGPKPKKVSTRVRSKAKRAIRRGMISEKAAKKHFGDY